VTVGSSVRGSRGAATKFFDRFVGKLFLVYMV